jgi:DNA-binding response OmpR family regulator
MRLLVVEDSEILRDNLLHGLRRCGHTVDATGDGREGLWYAEQHDYDAIVLDIMLPGLDGRSVLARLRGGGKATPVLFLTARDAIGDRVQGLRAGADDYLVKPFAFDELLARLEALTRRRYAVATRELRFGALEIDLSARCVRRGGAPLALPPREYALLEYLALRAGELVTRAEIEQHLYDAAAEPSSNVVDAAIYALRRLIDPRGGPSYIETRRGQGYVFGAGGAAP